MAGFITAVQAEEAEHADTADQATNADQAAQSDKVVASNYEAGKDVLGDGLDGQLVKDDGGTVQVRIGQGARNGKFVVDEEGEVHEEQTTEATDNEIVQNGSLGGPVNLRDQGIRTTEYMADEDSTTELWLQNSLIGTPPERILIHFLFVPSSSPVQLKMQIEGDDQDSFQDSLYTYWDINDDETNDDSSWTITEASGANSHVRGKIILETEIYDYYNNPYISYYAISGTQNSWKRSAGFVVASAITQVGRWKLFTTSGNDAQGQATEFQLPL